MQPAHQVYHIEYRIELYWPWANEERQFRNAYALWSHDDKAARVKRIPTGSQILFYETEHDYKDEGHGAKSIFAAGTLTDDTPESPHTFSDHKGRQWTESRLVELDRWVKPSQGVPLEEIRKVLGKTSSWKMRSGPYPIGQNGSDERHSPCCGQSELAVQQLPSQRRCGLSLFLPGCPG